MENCLMKCRIAELNIEILNRDNFTNRICNKYLADFASPDVTLSADDGAIAYEHTLSLDDKFNFGRLEAVALCRQLGLILPTKGALMLHGATFSLEDKGIIFLAKSGTGKSTHMLLWQQLFGDKLEVINGDKPIVRFDSGVPVAYGTPWCGKEGLSKNKSVPLTDLCFIKRSVSNDTRELSRGEALSLLLEQVVIPSGSENIILVLDILDRLLSSCRLWEIGCNTDIAAAEHSSSIILR